LIGSGWRFFVVCFEESSINDQRQAINNFEVRHSTCADKQTNLSTDVT